MICYHFNSSNTDAIMTTKRLSQCISNVVARCPLLLRTFTCTYANKKKCRVIFDAFIGKVYKTYIARLSMAWCKVSINRIFIESMCRVHGINWRTLFHIDHILTCDCVPSESTCECSTRIIQNNLKYHRTKRKEFPWIERSRPNTKQSFQWIHNIFDLHLSTLWFKASN